MTRILLALDGSDASLGAAARAHQLFGDDAEYLAINVFEAPNAIVPTVSDPLIWGAVWRYDVLAATEEDREAARAAAAEDARDEAEQAGVGATRAIGKVGDPATAIVEAAGQHAADVIVVGAHQRGWFSRLFDPPVAADVVKRADTPVLVVREADA